MIDVLTLDGEKIAAVTGFLTGVLEPPRAVAQASGAEVFARFGLPASPA